MKRVWLFLLAVGIVSGCAYQGKTIGEYLEDPKSFLQDPHYMEYREKRDQLEADYLNRKMSYSEYRQEVQALDDNYAKEVYQRNQIITNQ